MVFIDTHAHLDFDDFEYDRKELVEEFRKNNIVTLSNTLSFKNYKETLELYKDFSDVVKVCPGLCPQEAEGISDEDFEEYLRFIKKRRDDIILIGEVGLDRKHTLDEMLFEKQVSRFRSIIELAIELDKPLSIHTRKAEKEVIGILREYVEAHNFRKFILHCFTGKKKLIKDIRELKLYCSIPLIVLNTQSFRMLVEELAISQILAETDSPFLNPSKERNTPLNVPLVYREIAKIKGFDALEIENMIYRNYLKLIM